MKVSNPLTIIAIFAGVAETLATVALVKLPLEIQAIFVYFVMAFPMAIVLLFFFVLYFKNIVLYAPSDFDNQNHYLQANNLKEKVDHQMDEIFASINKRGAKLSQEELERAKSELAKTITKETMPARMMDILDTIGKSRYSARGIASELGLTPSTVITYLMRLEKDGLVEKDSSNIWKLRT
ncbi:winged helix-turn-helix domain-containing protein [Vibrio gallaecicus]|uniref:Winged helix-turn-helix domain-containing protein n=1 Tax=Vibrio gallaecicus TaxID=552386 RepID=A0ABV4NHN8_9VIBR